MQAQQVVTPTEEDTEEEAADARVATYDYLLSMPIASLTAEKVPPCTAGPSLCKPVSIARRLLPRTSQ